MKLLRVIPLVKSVNIVSLNLKTDEPEFHYLRPHTQSTILLDKWSGTHAQKWMWDGDKEWNKKYIGVIGI